jgi:hypothetical protein
MIAPLDIFTRYPLVNPDSLPQSLVGYTSGCSSNCVEPFIHRTA